MQRVASVPGSRSAGWLTLGGLALWLAAGAAPAVAANIPPLARDLKLITPKNEAISRTVCYYDPDGPTLTFQQLSTPAHGTLTSFNTATGAFSYTPSAGFTGEDQFTWQVSDGTDTSGVAAVKFLVRDVRDHANVMVDVIVDSVVLPEIQTEAQRLVDDLTAAGYTSRVTAWSNADPQALWTHLRTTYDGADFLSGAILLGAVPVPQANDGNRTDVIYWNLEGYNLTGTPYGAKGEIWASRLFATGNGFGDEVTLLKRALDANHDFRTGRSRYLDTARAYAVSEFSYDNDNVNSLSLIWTRVDPQVCDNFMPAWMLSGAFLQAGSHGSGDGYQGVWSAGIHDVLAQVRFNVISACSCGALGGIANNQTMTRGGGNVLSVGASNLCSDDYVICKDRTAKNAFRNRLTQGYSWGQSALFSYPWRESTYTMIYGDLSLGARACDPATGVPYAENQKPAITALTQTPAGTVTPGQPVTFSVEISDPDAAADSPYVAFEHRIEWFMNGHNYGRNAPTYATDDTQGAGWNSVTHTFPAAGTYTIRAEVMDEWQARDWAELTITVNSPPVAAADTATVEAGNDVTIPVLANDVEPDGEALTLDTITAGPAHGTAVIAGAIVVYTATDLVWTGTDTFDYRVKDPRGLAATATVTVTVTADTAPPQVIAVSSAGDPTVVTVVFNERLLPGAGAAGAENPANYAIDQGVTIAAATLQADAKSVALAVSTLAEGVGYTLTVEHVADLKSNAMATPQLVCFQYYALLPGVKYEYYEGSWNALPDFSTLTPVAEGVVSTFDISVRLRNDQFAFRFTGVIQIDTAGAYTFYTTSDDGSKLYVDGAEPALVNNDGLHGMQEVPGTVTLAAGYHDLVVTMFEQGGGEGLEVRWEGSGIAKQIIPAGVLFHRPAGNTNHPPTIATPASADPNPVPRPAATSLSVTAADADADPLTYAWTQVTGPGTVTFGAPTAPAGTASFSVAGDYLLRVTVSDGKGASVTSDVTVTVKPHAGDVNADNVINAIDLQIIIANFGQTVGSPGCDTRADANGDGVVNALDLQIVIANFGQSVP